MKYIVVVHWMFSNGKPWKTIQKEFMDIESAEAYAQEMYNSADPRKGEEINVLVYELKKSYN